MNLRTLALAGLLALSATSVAVAQETPAPQPGSGPAMMGQGWGGGMRGGGWGQGMMGYGGGRGYGSGMMMGGGWGAGMMGGGCGMMGYGAAGGDFDTYVEGRIAFLKAELKITKDQEAIWQDYADALTTNAQVMASMHKQMAEAFQKGDSSPMQFFDLHINAMKSRLAALEALKPATEALYKALSADQRKKADDVLPMMGGCM